MRNIEMWLAPLLPGFGTQYASRREKLVEIPVVSRLVGYVCYQDRELRKSLGDMLAIRRKILEK